MEQIREIEVFVNIFLQSLGPWLQSIMKVVTMLGDEIFFILVMPAIYWCVDAIAGLRVGAMLLLSGTFNNFFKLLIRGPRPYWISDKVVPVVHESSFGIPSGHAMNAASVWGWLAVEAKERWASLVSILVIFLIGFSRLVMGVHFLTDVMLGWVLGGLLVLAFLLTQKRIGQWLDTLDYRAHIGLAFASSMLMIMLVLTARNLYVEWQMPQAWLARAGEVDPLSINGALTMAGTWFGMFGGFALLRKLRGVLDSRGIGWKRLARFIIGLIGVLAIYLGLGQLFPSEADLISYILRYVRYGLIGLWVSMLAPLLFEKLELAKINPTHK